MLFKNTFITNIIQRVKMHRYTKELKRKIHHQYFIYDENLGSFESTVIKLTNMLSPIAFKKELEDEFGAAVVALPLTYVKARLDHFNFKHKNKAIQMEGSVVVKTQLVNRHRGVSETFQTSQDQNLSFEKDLYNLPSHIVKDLTEISEDQYQAIEKIRLENFNESMYFTGRYGYLPLMVGDLKSLIVFTTPVFQNSIPLLYANHKYTGFGKPKAIVLEQSLVLEPLQLPEFTPDFYNALMHRLKPFTNALTYHVLRHYDYQLDSKDKIYIVLDTDFVSQLTGLSIERTDCKIGLSLLNGHLIEVRCLCTTGMEKLNSIFGTNAFKNAIAEVEKFNDNH